MRFEWIEKLFMMLCVISVLTAVGCYVKGESNAYDYRIRVMDEEAERIRVTVTGEVDMPGTYSLKKNSRVCDVLYAAGGITHNADVDQLRLDAVLSNTTEINVPSYIDYDVYSAPVIDINKADVQMLSFIPGIGEKLAERIVSYRSVYGDFETVYDLTKVSGIGEKTLSGILDYIKTEE